MTTLESNLLTAGKRLKKARLMAGISTRKEFFAKANISANTLQGWEQDKNRLSLKGAQRVVDALWKEGVMCSAEWLLYGRGMPPRVMESNYFDQKAFQNLEKLDLKIIADQETRIAQEKALFTNLNPNSVIFRVDDDAMSPIYEPNTLVGGAYYKPEEVSQFFGWACIAEFQHEQTRVITVRNLAKGDHENTVTLCGINSAAKHSVINYYNVKLVAFAPIIWIRKTLTNISGGIIE